MRIFTSEGRRRNQTGASVPVNAASIPMSNRLGIDDGLLSGGTPNKPDVETVDPEERPRRDHPRTNPPPPWKPSVDDDEVGYSPAGSPPTNYGFSYATKKNIAQGMMDLALLTANASQLRYIMRSPYWDLYHKINVTLISISIALQIIAGVMLIFIGRYDFKKKESRYLPQLLSDIIVLVIFIITVVNIFIAAFGVDDERTTFLRWKEETTGIVREPFTLPNDSVPPSHHP